MGDGVSEGESECRKREGTKGRKGTGTKGIGRGVPKNESCSLEKKSGN